MSIDLKAEILDKGYVVIEEFFNSNLAASVKEAIQDRTNKMMVLKGDSSTRYVNLLGTHSIFEELLLDYDIDTIAKSILGEHTNLVDFEILTLHPGAAALSSHIDYPFVLMDKVFVDPIASLQTLWALDDFTETNGATLIVPGSHKERKFPDSSFNDRCQPLFLKQGSVVVFHGALWHGTMPNLSDQNRSSALVSFAPIWVKPLSQLDTNVNKEDYMKPAMRDLLGYNNKRFIYKNLKMKQKTF